ncbi:Diadenylate cyclase spyDAC [Desulfovibrio sp. DV]|nr:Diadenylate cyclase spyDAC [Desulfovibrio sp. DV]
MPHTFAFTMGSFIDNLHITWRELLDIAVVTFIFYRGLLLIRGTRAASVLHGFLLILIIYYVSGEFGLNTLHWLLTNFLGSIFLVIIILFQADIRKALSSVGAGGFFRRRRETVSEAALDEYILAVFQMARTHTGALIVFERRVPLGDYVQRGVELGARPSRELLGTIFFPDTPLHDGAVIIQGESVAAAGCILPLIAGVPLDASLGTRHRAALGITEETDALAVVVSEERGVVSVADGGKLISPVDEMTLKNMLWNLVAKRP